MPDSFEEFLGRDWRTYSSLDTTHKLMSVYTGNAVGEHEALVQRIVRILGTPLGSRVWNREFGSNLFQLVDRPMNSMFYMDAYAATADSLNRCEPLFRLQQTRLEEVSEAEFEITLDGLSLIDNQVISVGDIIFSLRPSNLLDLSFIQLRRAA